jgi:hypothetical protein
VSHPGSRRKQARSTAATNTGHNFFTRSAAASVWASSRRCLGYPRCASRPATIATRSICVSSRQGRLPLARTLSLWESKLAENLAPPPTRRLSGTSPALAPAFRRVEGATRQTEATARKSQLWAPTVLSCLQSEPCGRASTALGLPQPGNGRASDTLSARVAHVANATGALTAATRSVLGHRQASRDLPKVP